MRNRMKTALKPAIALKVQIITAPIPVLAQFGPHWVIVGWRCIENVPLRRAA